MEKLFALLDLEGDLKCINNIKDQCRDLWICLIPKYFVAYDTAAYHDRIMYNHTRSHFDLPHLCPLWFRKIGQCQPGHNFCKTVLCCGRYMRKRNSFKGTYLRNFRFNVHSFSCEMPLCNATVPNAPGPNKTSLIVIVCNPLGFICFVPVWSSCHFY